MQLLIIAATETEIKLLLEKQNSFNNVQLDAVISGVGMVATTLELTKALMSKKYDLVVNAGIAGAFNREINIGDVVEVCEDRFSELGIENGDKFLPAEVVNLIKIEEVVSIAINGLSLDLKKVSGITVNRVHGNLKSIEEVQRLYNPDVESMEGAAVLYTCKKMGVKCLQIRSISNYVELRNKENWNIPLAINNLNIELEKIINSL
jgi:futalosine hydrolase